MKPSELAQKTGLSVPYASQILKGRRTPPDATARLIYDKAGLKHGYLKGLSDEKIGSLRAIHWPDRAA